MVELVVLGSGSRGNATLVRCGRHALLIDAGLSARQLERRMAAVGQDPAAVEAIFISHEHTDHIAGARVFTRRHPAPVIANEATLDAGGERLEGPAGTACLPTGGTVEVGPFRVTSFPVPHDAAEPVGYVIEAEGLRLGHATDLGHVTYPVAERLGRCHGIVFESNHDRDMLINGPYPWMTKQRVASRLGHLSNDMAALELCRIAGSDTLHVVLAHLSETNNHPGLAATAVRAALADAELGAVEVSLACQSQPCRPVKF
jgi:phosphoribosyl 1,2-cyclic phosphodiesterase